MVPNERMESRHHRLGRCCLHFVGTQTSPLCRRPTRNRQLLACTSQPSTRIHAFPTDKSCPVHRGMVASLQGQTLRNPESLVSRGLPTLALAWILSIQQIAEFVLPSCQPSVLSCLLGV